MRLTEKTKDLLIKLNSYGSGAHIETFIAYALMFTYYNTEILLNNLTSFGIAKLGLDTFNPIFKRYVINYSHCSDENKKNCINKSKTLDDVKTFAA